MPILRDTVERAASLAWRTANEARAAGYMYRAGMIGHSPPRQTVAALRALGQYGQLGAGPRLAAIRHGQHTGLIDELGALSFAEVDERSNALACALADRGVNGEDCIGLLARNHRGFLDATFAAAKLGARTVYLNTDFSGPQLRETCAREEVTLLAYDEEFDELVGGFAPPHGALIAWHESDTGADTLEQLIADAAGRVPPPPPHHSRIVLLTSGTTGAPRGAPRRSSLSIAPIGAMLSKVPFRATESTLVAPPLFHALGYTQTLLAFTLGCTAIVQRYFSPERTLDAVAEHRPTTLVLVPVMLRRIVAALEEEPGRWDTSSLRIVFVSGSQLEAELVRRVQRTLGDKLYNYYGSTEAGSATFATPEDLRAAPGTVGRPPFGTVIRLYDEGGHRITNADTVGRIFVGNSFQFEGYTGGGSKEVIDGLMSTGDVGHLDEAGRLFIDGRDDDMVISGGENLFPSEVEELLVTHPTIEEAAVIGVDDLEFGKRLAAFVVVRLGEQLTEVEIKEFVRGNLARFKVPRDVCFVERLPRNPAGKVLKRRLRELHADPDALEGQQSA